MGGAYPFFNKPYYPHLITPKPCCNFSPCSAILPFHPSQYTSIKKLGYNFAMHSFKEEDELWGALM